MNKTGPVDWEANLGKQVELEGKAVNKKSGAYLVLEENGIWIDSLEYWSDEFSSGGKEGNRVRVSGTVGTRHDLPVFIETPGGPIQSGIPVPEGTDLHEASKRFLLFDASWELVKEDGVK